jgi:Tfp pilus assembly protein PilV
MAGVSLLAVAGIATGTVAVIDSSTTSAQGAASTQQYCATLQELMLPQSAKPDASTFHHLDQLTEQLAGQAPDQVRDQVRQYASGMHSFVAEVEKVSFDVTQIKPEQYATLQSPEMIAASEVIVKSATDDCKLPGLSQPTEAPSSATTPAQPPASGAAPAASPSVVPSTPAK